MKLRGLAVCAGLICAATLISSQFDSIRYVDIAQASGLEAPNTFGGRLKKDYILETTGNGAAIFDFDGDGWNDIFITNGTTLDHPEAATPSRLYRNEGNGRFTDVTEKAGLTQVGWAQGVCVADFDNDGRPDMLVTYYGHDRLFRNDGNGKFSDVTSRAGLPVQGTRWGTGCAFLDYDRDGWVDLFVANYVDLNLSQTPRPGSTNNCVWKGIPVMCGPRGLPLARNALYHNNRDGTFTDVSDRAGILKPGGRYGLGVIVSDFDNDGWPDIYVACDQTSSLLYHNRRDGTFEERGVQAGVAYNADGQTQSGMGVAVADYDGNGFLDIAKTNFSGDLPSLYNNEDGKFFTDLAGQSGLGANQLLGWGIAFVDLDEDGWKDLVLANGHVYPEVDRAALGEKYLQRTLVYRNLGNGRFSDITAQAGPAFQTPRPARGLAVGDLDGDGRPEIVIVNMNEPPSLLKNTSAGHHAIRIALAGTKSNRSAIGARVEARAGTRTQIDEVRSGSSYLSQNDLTLHFGLGGASVVDSIKVRWPNGAAQEWKQVAADQTITLTEGSAEFRRDPFKASPVRPR